MASCSSISQKPNRDLANEVFESHDSSESNDSKESSSTPFTTTAEAMLEKSNCWPLTVHRIATDLLNPQMTESTDAFADYRIHQACFDKNIRENFNFDPFKLSDKQTPSAGFAYLLVNADYLYSKSQMKDLAFQLKRNPDDAQLFKKTFTIDNINTDTQVLGLEGDDFYLVIFQGTSSGMDWINNFNLLRTTSRSNSTTDEGYHRGFWINLESVRESLVSELNLHPQKKVFFIGHSLGGALAHIFLARSIKESGFFDANRIDTISSWGAPRSMSPALANEIEIHSAKYGVTIQHFSRPSDPVPHLPPISLGYQAVTPHLFRNPLSLEWSTTSDYRYKSVLKANLLDPESAHMGRGYFNFHATELNFLNEP